MGEFGIIGGPNGAGKTTLVDKNDSILYSFFEQYHPDFVINPDNLVRQYNLKTDSYDRSVQQARRHIQESLVHHQYRDFDHSLVVETVLSSDKYFERCSSFDSDPPTVSDFQSAGHSTALLYVAVNNPEECIHRVEHRASFGEHSIPPDKIRDRFERSIDTLGRNFQEPDRLIIVSNQGMSNHRPVAVRDGSSELLVSDDYDCPWINDRLPEYGITVQTTDPGIVQDTISMNP